MWGVRAPVRLDLQSFKRDCAKLAKHIAAVERRVEFGPLVGSSHLREAPIHRWYSYKEGYSPQLLPAVIEILGLSGTGLHVADVFGGVGTTALAGQAHGQVGEVRSLEYSRWARFVGATKLAWPFLDPGRLRLLLRPAVEYEIDATIPFPALASFSNPRIFDPQRVRSLLAAREHVRRLPGSTQLERDFFVLGLGAVAEDLSYVMKDGRALRVKGERKRRASSLGEHPHPALRVNGRVQDALVGQWTAMIDDLDRLADKRALTARTPAQHVVGDARQPNVSLVDGSDTTMFPDGWANLSCFSPPYLNCIDYTELYKLELWLMEHITTQEQFRRARLGTLRSHPSVAFPTRDSFSGIMEEPVIRLICAISEWLSAHGARRDVGPMVRNYFEDMLEVWRAQHVMLADDGVAVCVVANSTFSRRERKPGGDVTEHWRLPLLTDVLLAHLARLAGFGRVEIWDARALRPRNVRWGAARESAGRCLRVASHHPADRQEDVTR